MLLGEMAQQVLSEEKSYGLSVAEVARIGMYIAFIWPCREKKAKIKTKRLCRIRVAIFT